MSSFPVAKAAACTDNYSPGLLLHTGLFMAYSFWLRVATQRINNMISIVTCRPGWSEGPTGKQLTADLKSRRAVATFADLGMPPS